MNNFIYKVLFIKSLRLKQFLVVLIFFSFLTAFSQTTTIKGRIVNNKNLPLPSAIIIIDSNKQQLLSDSDGNFTLETTAQFPVKLQVRSIGYLPTFITIGNSSFISIILEEETSALAEVLISSGYFTQRKKESSGSVSKIASAQLINRPTTSFDQLLGGQATGVDVVQSTAVLNNTPVIRIRGLNTITSGVFPLIVIDGVAVFTGSFGGFVGNNPLSAVNPNDIQSIYVLKDAAAAAIYGSRAANGVMVIATKKGQYGKTRVNYNSWYSTSKPYNLPELLGAEDYTMIKNEAMVNAGKAPGFFVSKNPDGSIVDTNWYDVAYKPAFSFNQSINISGANETTDYYFSADYTDMNSFIKENTFEQYNTRLNVGHKINQAIKIGANISFSTSKNVGPNTGAVAGNTMGSSTYNTEYITNEPLGRMTYVLPPNVPVYNPDGTYSIQNGISVGYGANVPALIGTINAYNLAMVQTLDLTTSTNNSLLGNVYGEFDILDNLTFKTSFGLNKVSIENQLYLNPIHGGGSSYNGVATNISTNLLKTDWFNTLTYKTTIKENHNLNFLLGYERIKNIIDSWGASQSNVTDSYYDNYQGVYTNTSPVGNVLAEDGLLSYFSNVNYGFQNKYFVSLNYRRDGLSALADENKYGNFGSGAVSWNISEETFYKNSSIGKVIDNLKFRTSYGIVGNSEIGIYPSVGVYNSATYIGAPTLGYAQTSNPNLQWETSTKFDVGIAFTVLRDRVSVEFDYYNNKIKDLILKNPQSLSAGIPNNYINENIGGMYNKGFELGINTLVIRNKNFSWTADLNLSTLKNQITSLVSDVFVPNVFGVQNMTREGYSVGSIFAVPCNGVNPENGQMVFVNHNGQEVQYNHIGSPKWTFLDGSPAPAIDNYLDGQIQGPSLPKFFGGFNNTFTYKNFVLGINLTFVQGNLLYNGTRATISDQRYFNNGTFIKDRWTTPGQITEIQKLYYGDNVSAGFSFSSTSKVEDGSYLKFKNVTLGYNLPVEKVLQKSPIQSVYMYIQANNFYTFTKYLGSDPEVSINGNSINSGKDQNVTPNAESITFGLNVGF